MVLGDSHVLVANICIGNGSFRSNWHAQMFYEHRQQTTVKASGYFLHMKLVIDSNGLRDDRLLTFLRTSPSNVAIITDYAAMEALKGDPVLGMSESMKFLAEFPNQVWVLRNTQLVCGLSGVSKGLQRRLLDVPSTKQFARFCAALDMATNGNRDAIDQLVTLGQEARRHLDRVEQDARGFAENSVSIAREFSTQEQEQIVSEASLSKRLLDKLFTHVACLATVIFQQHPQVKNLPQSSTVLNTYIFRSSLAHMLLGFQYASYGGVSGKSTEKVRNDMVDSHFACYSTFYDGILSNDRRTNWLAVRTRNLLIQAR